MASLNKTVTARYEGLKGVDFSCSPSLVDKYRSPDCLNLMPDGGRNPVKRPGWQTVYSLGEQVHNIWFCTLEGISYTLCHCGDKIYSLGNENKVLKSGVNSAKGCGFYALNGDKGQFFILTGNEFLVFDGENIKNVSDDGYVPLVAIAKNPQGVGESYEDINLLSNKRKEAFTGTENDLIYQLGCEEIDGVDKIEISDENGDKTVLEKDTDYTFDLSLGKITFADPHPTKIAGEDNIFVTYIKDNSENKQKIEKCTVAALFGLGGENRVFLSGNSACGQKDFWSDVFNPYYFPDLNYSIIGSSQTSVMGYLKLGEYLGIVKEGNGQDTALFMRKAVQNGDDALFIVQSGISGYGAVSKGCFAVLADEPLFLSSRGIFAVTDNALTSEKIIVNRSYQVDAKLTAENNLEDAVACVWKDFYILSVNGNCYLLDSRQVVQAKSGEKNARYEAYFWNNVHANCFAVKADELWFGTKDGHIRKFKNDLSDMECYSDDGEAITAYWQTPIEDDGYIERFKTLLRNGCVVTLTPYEKSGCSVYCSVDGGKKQLLQKKYLDISTAFSEVDFARFTFSVNTNPREIYFYTRKARYKRIQLIFENNGVNEGFGIQKITKTYKINIFSKNVR